MSRRLRLKSEVIVLLLREGLGHIIDNFDENDDDTSKELLNGLWQICESFIGSLGIE